MVGFSCSNEGALVSGIQRQGMESEVYGLSSNAMETEVSQAEFFTANIVGISFVVVDGYYVTVMEQDGPTPMFCLHLVLCSVIGRLILFQFGDYFGWMHDKHLHLQATYQADYTLSIVAKP